MCRHGRIARAGHWRCGGIALFAVVLLGGCGNGERSTDGKLRNASITSPDAAGSRDALLTDAEINAAPGGSPEQALLRFWSDLQYQALPAAVDTYSDQLLAHLDIDTVTEALKTQVPYFRLTKPQIVGVRPYSAGGRVVLFHVRDSASSTMVPRSMTFRRIGRRWRIVYDPFLDSEMTSSVQAAVQAHIDPTATKPSEQAIRAGYAAGRLQSAYLKALRLLRATG